MKWGKIKANRVKIASKTRTSVLLTYFLSMQTHFYPVTLTARTLFFDFADKA